jgi:hypothetical protein
VIAGLFVFAFRFLVCCAPSESARAPRSRCQAAAKYPRCAVAKYRRVGMPLNTSCSLREGANIAGDARRFPSFARSLRPHVAKLCLDRDHANPYHHLYDVKIGRAVTKARIPKLNMVVVIAVQDRPIRFSQQPRGGAAKPASAKARARCIGEAFNNAHGPRGRQKAMRRLRLSCALGMTDKAT